MLASRYLILSVGNSLLPILAVLEWVLILVGERATRPPALPCSAEAILIAGMSASSSSPIDATSLTFARVCRGANRFSLSSLNTVIVAWRLARKVAEFGPAILFSRWVRRMPKLLIPASIELLVRFPKTEDAIV
jgi:hypothetical protein